MTAVAIRQHTPEWHAFRDERITATDAAIIAGEKGSVLQLWAEKRHLVEPEEFDATTRELMDDGLMIQPFLVAWYAHKTGRRVRNINTVRTSKEWPVAACSPDGEVVGEPVGIEVKMTTSARWPAAHREGEPVPGDVFAQVQWQMYVTGWTRVDVVVLLFGRPRVIEVPRDDAYIADLVAMARQFHGWVLSGERPPVDGSENARRVLSAMHPQGDGNLVPAPADVEELVRALAQRKAEVKAAEGTIGSIENALRALIGDADGFEGPWGRVTWKRNADSTRTNWPAVATAFREALERVATEQELSDAFGTTSLDDVVSIHSETVPGPRVLRTSLKEAQA